MTAGRPGGGRRLCESFKVAQGADASHDDCSFEGRFASFAIVAGEHSGFDKTGHTSSRRYSSDTHEGAVADGPTPSVARFSLSGGALASSSAPASAPRLTDALLLAERIHAALVELSDGSATFTGCDEKGRPLEGHAHAYIFSESNLALGRGKGGEITHVTVYAPAGFGHLETSALESLREVCGSGLKAHLTLLGLGPPEDFGGCDARKGKSPLFAKSRSWTSRTPFIPTRHPKATRARAPKLDSTGLQIGSPEHELWRLLRLAGFPEPEAVEPVYFTSLAGEKTGWSSFRRARSLGGGRRAGSVGYGFQIEFPVPVQGPVALGYGAHFGMGGFVSDRIENSEDESIIGV